METNPCKRPAKRFRTKGLVAPPNYVATLPKKIPPISAATKTYIRDLTSQEYYIDAKRMTTSEFNEQRLHMLEKEKAFVSIP